MTTASHSLEFSDGSSHKFWKIELSGHEFTVTFGKIGTSGQTQTKSFSNNDEARKSYDKLVAEKTKKGYVNKDDSLSTTSASSASVKAPVQKASKKSSPAESKAKQVKIVSSAEMVLSTPVVVPVTQLSTSDVDLSTSREFDLTDDDWAKAHFRRPPAPPLPAPMSFDLDRCLATLAKAKTHTYGWEISWESLPLPFPISREEAHFWLDAMSTWRGRSTTPVEFSQQLSKSRTPFDGKLTAENISEKLNGHQRGLDSLTGLILLTLLSPLGAVEFIIKYQIGEGSCYGISPIDSAMLDGFRKYILPNLDDNAISVIKKEITAKWDPTQIPKSIYGHFPMQYYIAAGLGMSDLVYQVTSQLDAKRYRNGESGDIYQRPQDLVFGLATSDLIAAEWRRLELVMRTGDDVRKWIACTEDTALDCLVRSIMETTNKEKCEELIKAFVLVRSPAAAVGMT
ncbi:WGR domain-containing protein [Planctomicrobium sp. SH527]|uniref:WGR domain-containing protein n=1 Tax=Planctomicrobium sp. SH527 TaxID=3448123 RepID=UPI003F5BCFB5